MLIRFHHGLGVGHVYAHPTATIPISHGALGENHLNTPEYDYIGMADNLDPKQNGDINSAAHTANVDREPEEDNDGDENDLDEWEDDDANDDEPSDTDSALVGFDEMYGGDAVEMDYEN